MDIKKYIDIIIKNLAIIIVITFLTTVVTAYVVIYRISPTYESNTSIYVIKSDEGLQYSDMTVIKQLVKDYQRLLTSRMVTNTVADSLGLKDEEVNNLIKNVSVSQQGDSNIIQLTVRDKNPNRAQNIAEKFTNIFMEKVSSITTVKNVVVKAIDKPELPQKPVSPQKALAIIIAFLLGSTGSLSAVFIKESFNTTLRTSKDIEKYLKLKVLGAIPLRDIR
jgi:capsular polysaccharide biosynthesis protein